MNVAILLVAHAPLASALRSCALHVFPDAAMDIAAMDVASDDPAAATCQAIAALRARWPDQECLVLVDVAGATPCNLARQAPMSGPDAILPPTELLAGVNLPMLLRVVNYRHEPLGTLVARALAGGTQGMLQLAPADHAQPTT
jgi:PTS system ascorbate-specific IIA component